MTLEEAKKLINSCTRHELRDHAFGDSEVYWEKDGKEVADGYYGRNASCGSINEYVDGKPVGVEWSFSGREALELRKCGTTGGIERNDSTGPDRYQEGACMPSLTLEGVRK